MAPSVRLIASAFLATACLASAPAVAQTFSRTTHTGLYHPLVADLDGDGDLDLAGTATGTAAGVLLNTGSGAFGPLVTYSAGGNTQTIAGGDLNGDGRVDLVVTINQADIGVSLLMGNGDGTFQAPVILPNTAEADANTAVVTDLDNDGRNDIVIAHGYACYVVCTHRPVMSLLMGKGDGTFQPTRVVEVGRGMNKIAVGDFNRDGVKDLVIGASGARLYRLIGSGDGTFVQLETLVLGPTSNFIEISDVAVADFNRDGIQDLAAALSTDSSRIAVLTGIGDGNFQTPLIMQEALDVPQRLAVADYNGDTFADIAFGFANGNSGLFAIRNGNGNGSFQASRRYEVPPNQSSIGTVGMLTANFNGDARPDLMLSIGGASGAAWVLLNTTGSAPPPMPGTPTLISPTSGATVTLPFTFDWSDVTNAVRYRIQIDDSNNFSTPLVYDRIADTSQFAAPTLNPRGYWWRVRAVNSAGVEGPNSSIRSFTVGTTTTPPPTPAAPTLVSPANGATVAQPVTLDWSDVTGAANYRIQIDNSSAFSSPLVVDQTVFGSQFTAPNLAGTQHWWRVRGVNSAGTAGSFSSVRTFTPQGGTPPPPPPGEVATLTVSASGRNGERVTSSPAGINVSVPGTGSASFTVGTSITLSVTNGRDAIWSGACSSSGSKRKTCVFTFNGAASVSANVQ